jgi:hypothetical protein
MWKGRCPPGSEMLVTEKIDDTIRFVSPWCHLNR